jgi:predicted RNA methylase
LTPDDVFIDIGCGAGRVIFFIAAQNLKKVIGVELNEELIDAARQNYRALKLRNSPVEIVCADAAVFNMDEGTIFFMYNPFGYKTLRKVVANIKKSIEASPRKIRIVYYGLWHRHLLDDEDWLELEKEMDRGEILIWHNKY